MHELTASNATAYLAAAPGAPDIAGLREVRELAGGVSNVVLRVCFDDSRRDFVLKQSRDQLRTEAEWFSRLERIYLEIEALRHIEPWLPTGAVPTVLFEDRAKFVYAMTAVDVDHTVWKTQLLEGTADASVAETAATYLAAIHTNGASIDWENSPLADRTVFDELRVDPFYRYVAMSNRRLARPFEQVIEEVLSLRMCLVHADFSPKNLLVHASGLTLVDFETAHIGDPAFDLGFCLSHLFLKTVHAAERIEDFSRLAEAFWTAYRAGVHLTKFDAPAGRAYEPRILANLAGCLLARIDGKSVVDYLTAHQQILVRNFASNLMMRPLGSVALSISEFREFVANS